ncbi:hypothetical protein J3A78_003855 [Streptomyces sp. PvR006]|uniref:hypothetical protein n=1 Tax=Streptomyces sp. PvR006 TaxID=2817860 RepID=UPI001AE26678|nr:hypothetical protein [Streptomyces sp. PvR006]MBP2583377.1 hypothetical protein [Streptomyces sp. PvR006]
MNRRLSHAVDVAARHGIAQRLADGSRALYDRLTAALTAWAAAGRRDDLTGWRAALGPILRLVLLGGLAYGAYRAARAAPWLMWLAAAAWTLAAWRAGGHEETPAEEPETTPEEHPAEAAVALLREVLGDRPAVHLSEVLAHLQKQGQGEDWKVADLRLRLEALGIPVDPKVKLRGVPTRGVRAADLDHHFPTRETSPSPTQVDAA